jgi:hypothetical protein
LEFALATKSQIIYLSSNLSFAQVSACKHIAW